MGRNLLRRSVKADKASLLKSEDSDDQLFPDTLSSMESIQPIKESSQMDVSSATGATEESINNSLHSMQLSVADNDDDEDDSDPEAEQGKFLADFSAFMLDEQGGVATSPSKVGQDNSTSHANEEPSSHHTSAEELAMHIGELPTPGSPKKKTPGWKRKSRSKSDEVAKGNSHARELASKPSPKKNSRDAPSRAKSMEEKPPAKIGSPGLFMRKKKHQQEEQQEEYVPPSGLEPPVKGDEEETATGHGSEVGVKEVGSDDQQESADNYVQMSFGPEPGVSGVAPADEKDAESDESETAADEPAEQEEAEPVTEEPTKKSRRRRRPSSRGSKINDFSEVAAASAAVPISSPSRSGRKSSGKKSKDKPSRIKRSTTEGGHKKSLSSSRTEISRSKSASNLLGDQTSQSKNSADVETRKVSRRKSMTSGGSGSSDLKKSSRRKSSRQVIKVPASALKGNPDALADVAAALAADQQSLSAESAAALAAAFGDASEHNESQTNGDASPAKPARRKSGRLMGFRMNAKEQSTPDLSTGETPESDVTPAKKQSLKDRITRYIPKSASFRQKRRASFSKNHQALEDDDDDEDDLAN